MIGVGVTGIIGPRVRLGSSIVTKFIFSEDYDGTTLRMGSVEFTAGTSEETPSTVTGGHANFDGGDVSYATDASEDPLLDILNNHDFAVSVPINNPGLGTAEALFSASAGVNNQNFIALYTIGDEARVMIDGQDLVTAQNITTSTDVLTAGTDHLVTMVKHNKSDGTSGKEISIYVDGLPYIENVAITNLPAAFDRIALGSRVGTTEVHKYSGIIRKNMSIMKLSDSSRKAQVKEACQEMFRIIDESSFLNFIEANFLFLTGQSNNLGSGSSTTSAIALAAGTMYGVDVSTAAERLIPDLDDTNVSGITRIKQQSGVAAYADEMLTDAGLVTIVCQGSVSGSPQLFATSSSQPGRWEITDDPTDRENGLLTSSSAIATNSVGAPAQSEILQRCRDILDLHPGIRINASVMLHNQGEAEAGQLTDTAGPLSVDTYSSSILGTWDEAKRQFDFDLMIIEELCASGADLTEMMTNEPGRIRVRTGQAAAVAARTDIVWGAQPGAEFGPLVTGADGEYVSGVDLITGDEAHYTNEMATAMKRKSAKNVILSLSL